MKKALISIVLPCLDEEKNIGPIISDIKRNIPRKYNYEIIIVDDGSRDNTSIVIEKESKKDKRVKGIILHKNFGHQMALMAGINAAKGESVITMDADFQHPPKLIPKMIKKWELGHDLVQLVKRDKGTRTLGYKIWSFVSGGTLTPGVGDFRLLDKKLVSYLVKSKEREVFLRGLSKLLASNLVNINYTVDKRKFGKTSYTLIGVINVFINGFISFSTFPLRIAAIAGIFIISLAGIALVADIIRAFISHEPIAQGFVTLVLLTLILNGFMIFYMGILGEYIGVIFKEVKKRPKYLIRETFNI